MLARSYAKPCDVADFADPELLDAATDILPERDAASHVERKVWEFAMLALFLRETGRLTEQTEALGVGAGNERILYWLANRVGKVIATDIYGHGDFAAKEAEPSMLTQPEAFAPFPYRQDHLEVLWMDARALDFADESFDVVFSLSSIEHFGSPADVARAAAEMGRVLKPGGHAFIATDLLVRLHPLDRAPFDLARKVATAGRRHRTATLRRRSALAETFTAGELERLIVCPSGLERMQELDLGISDENWQNVCRLHRDDTLEPASGSYFPHVLVRISRSTVTSVALPLHKPG